MAEGGLLMDTPGMREFQPWEQEEDQPLPVTAFETIEAKCRFSNCQHGQEPGCAVREAIAEGRLAPSA
jgi:ribosome biogenesis GTPase / thiamine phosphate phosphatase